MCPLFVPSILTGRGHFLPTRKLLLNVLTGAPLAYVHLPRQRTPAMQSLVVLTPLRWSLVRQRAHHLMSRLAGWYDVKFIEQPVFAEGSAHLAVRHVAPGLTVLVPHTPLREPGFSERQRPYLKALLAGSVAREHGLNGALCWLNTPEAWPVAEMLDPALVVYDCMGLQDAAHAAAEATLLRHADLVLTAGPTLYEAQRHHHPQVHCLPNAVDAAHFAPAGLDPDDLQADLAQALQGALPRPRLGFFGVIDDRIDLALLAGLADARPAWQIVMAGPVAGNAQAALPQRPNIHWLGQQPYARLPHLLAGWDLALMPFVLNDTTATLSPTMTLEYLAGEKPVVSTPLRDVARLHGHVVRLAGGVLDFVAACDATLAETPRQRSRRVMEMLTTVSTLSWDRTAAAIHTLIEEARARRETEHTDDAVPEVAAALHAPAGRRAPPTGRAPH
jgi:glycosyltransferase involved in cell wall biosynthesis